MTKEELVNLCKEGDKQALSLLYTTYANKMKRICSQYISDKQTVNDLLHDGFIIILLPSIPCALPKSWKAGWEK